MYLSRKCKSSLLICRLLFKQPKQTLKDASYLSLIQRKSILDKSKYELVYEFPPVKYAGAFSRSRYSVVAFTVIASPFLYYFTSLTSALVLLASSGFHFTLSAISARLSENMVGKIYINKEGDLQEVIISSLDKFGKRTDKTHNPDEFINCDHYSTLSRSFGFIRLVIENSDVNYKINIKNCKIHNSEVCNYLLGRIWTVRREKDKEQK